MNEIDVDAAQIDTEEAIAGEITDYMDHSPIGMNEEDVAEISRLALRTAASRLSVEEFAALKRAYGLGERP